MSSSEISNKISKKFSNLDKVHQYLRNSIDKMKVKQEKLMDKYNFGEKKNKFMLYPERNAFYMFNQDSKNVFFKAKFQIIGTYSEKSRTWRWGWSNRFVPYDLKKTSLKIKKFGESNKIDILSQPKIKDENMGHIFTALGMSLSQSHGYYIIPGTKVYPQIFIIFTKVERVDLEYDTVVKEMRNESRKNSTFFKQKLKLGSSEKKPKNKNQNTPTKKVNRGVKRKTSKKKVELVTKILVPMKKKIIKTSKSNNSEK